MSRAAGPDFVAMEQRGGAGPEEAARAAQNRMMIDVLGWAALIFLVLAAIFPKARGPKRRR